jgi:methyl-accepting chemotaxis protein
MFLTRSIAAKVHAVVGLVFMLTMSIGLVRSYLDADASLKQFASNEASILADTYFDRLNKLMLTGDMAQRDGLGAEMARFANVRAARVLRGAAVSGQYGPGRADETAGDDIDRRVLGGEEVTLIRQLGEERMLTVARPFRASANTRGVNCLNCHQAPSGGVLGAVRIDYSLARHDGQLFANLAWQIAYSLVALVIGMVVLAFVLRKVLAGPLKEFGATLQAIEQNSDLTLRFATSREDELGELSRSFNSMLEKFALVVAQVRHATGQLGETSRGLSLVAQLTKMGVERQLTDTASLNNAMQIMARHIRDVDAHSGSTAQAATRADDEARKNVAQSHAVLDATHAMENELEHARAVIRQLDTESRNIDNVVVFIDEIAEQTNLLALNAAIEAARAGEAGRGFAVVADKVRELAQRTQEATLDIRATIDKIQSGARQAVSAILAASDKTEASVAQVDLNVEGLKDIAAAVSVITEKSRQIGEATRIQIGSADTVYQNIQNIDQATNQTASAARQTHDASEDLTVITATLQALVAQFRIDDGSVQIIEAPSLPTHADNSGSSVELF